MQESEHNKQAEHPENITLAMLEQYADLRREVAVLKEQQAEQEEQALAQLLLQLRMEPEEPGEESELITAREIRVAQQERRMRIVQTYAQRIVELEEMLERIENWIQSVSDSRIRQMIELKYLRGLTWNATASRIYGSPCGDTARKYMSRYFEK